MIIVCQNRRRTVNFERVVEFYIDYNKKEHTYNIKADLTSCENRILGKYSSEKQADQIFNILNQAIGFAGNAMNVNGSTQLQLPIYYMPEQVKENEKDYRNY